MIVFLIIGCIATVLLSIPSIWTNPKKPWIPWVIGTVAVICQATAWVSQNSVQEKLRTEQAEAQRKLREEVSEAKTYAAVTESRAQDLQKRSDIAIGLLNKTSKSISDQDLRRQVQETVTRAKLDQIASNTEKKGLGSSPLGRHFGPPEERIAGTLERLERGIIQDLELEMRRGKSSRELTLEYFDAVSRIPEFYSDEAWSKIEEMIVGNILSSIQSNLTKRNIYTKERYESYANVVRKESARYKAERKRFQTSSPNSEPTQ